MTIRRMVAVLLTAFASSLVTVVTVTGLDQFTVDLLIASFMAVGVFVIAMVSWAWDERRERARARGRR